MGQALIDRHFGHQVKDKETFQDAEVYYRLLDDDDSSALNAGDLPDCEPRAGKGVLSWRIIWVKISVDDILKYFRICPRK